MATTPGLFDYDVAVIGAGISGIATAKCLLDDKFKIVVFEKSDHIGGLWHFTENGYGVMRFTHINVSKYNYCFSDYPFPDDIPDYPHHSHMAAYVQNYAKNFGLFPYIRFQTKVVRVEKAHDEGWKISSVEVDENGKECSDVKVELCRFVAIATGHHAKANMPMFEGQLQFQGKVVHSVSYKDAVTNGLVGKRVAVVGIGNSAVDVAVNVVEKGGVRPVYISTRSGAWIIPNYVAGFPTDNYACRVFFWLPFWLSNFVFELIVQLVNGSPYKWNLNPTMKALQTQPTVSPTLIHHIQRGNVRVKPNIAQVESDGVLFTDGTRAQVDAIVFCTGYLIDLHFLSGEVKDLVLEEGTNTLKLFKNVFSPELGASLAFIGFAQPASGGLLTISETQARWFSELCKGTTKLPGKAAMYRETESEQSAFSERFHSSPRHTIQRDPIPYNDEIAGYFGAKPQLWRHPSLAWNLVVGSCGPAQWRLQGPHKWSKAKSVVRSVPVTPLMHYGLLGALSLLGVVLGIVALKLSFA